MARRKYLRYRSKAEGAFSDALGEAGGLCSMRIRSADNPRSRVRSLRLNRHFGVVGDYKVLDYMYSTQVRLQKNANHPKEGDYKATRQLKWVQPQNPRMTPCIRIMTRNIAA